MQPQDAPNTPSGPREPPRIEEEIRPDKIEDDARGQRERSLSAKEATRNPPPSTDLTGPGGDPAEGKR